MESPFACWMERLTLENPEHGIPPDVGSRPPTDAVERQDDIAETLRSENKDVSLIDWDADEPFRRSATMQAMRQGVDFIVNGQLALGTLSAPANLLMRTSGYSSLGDYLYIPCDTQGGRARHAPFRLCFLAELLRSLQGQLPPQLLLIDGDDLVSLQTDDHIHHYRAVLQRFRAAMESFRKHRMPEPAESSHFGRWGDCARELLKQRMLRQERRDEELTGDESMPMRQAVGDGVGEMPEAVDLAEAGRHAGRPAGEPLADGLRGEFGFRRSGAAPSGPTLAEQARMLRPGISTVSTVAPGPAGERRAAGSGSGTLSANTGSVHKRRASDAVLQNLEFIGAPRLQPQIGEGPPPRLADAPLLGGAPSPSLRDPRPRPRPTEPESEPVGEWPIRTTGYVPVEAPRCLDGDRPAPFVAGERPRGNQPTAAPLDALRTGPEEASSASGEAPMPWEERSPDTAPGRHAEFETAAPEDLRPDPASTADAPVPPPADSQPPPKESWQPPRRVTGQGFAPGPNVDLDSSLPVSPPTALATAGTELPEEEIAVVEDADAAFEEYQRLRAKARFQASRSPRDALMTADREDD